MCNRLLITMAIVSSFTLAGCNSLLYSNKLAPVYSKGNSNTPPPALNNPPTTEINSIERPQSGSGVVVNSAQNNPYGNSSAIPQRPAGMNTNGYPNAADPAAGTLPSAASKASQINDPRIREASDIIDQTNTNQTAKTGIPAVDRPMSTVRKGQDKVEAAVNTGTGKVDSAASKVNSETGKAVDNATSAVTASLPKPATQKTATKALLQEARTAVGEGNYDKAASALERAHRIEPGNAKILYDIAQIRYAQGKYRQSESFASKAANYSSSGVLSKKIWTLLSNSRKALGNNTGAEAAAKKAANF